jgi:hypothetical protein
LNGLNYRDIKATDIYFLEDSCTFYLDIFPLIHQGFSNNLKNLAIIALQLGNKNIDMNISTDKMQFLKNEFYFKFGEKL